MIAILDTIIQASAVILLCWGLWEVGNKKLRGPIIAAAAELIIIVVGLMHGAWSVTVIGIVLFIVHSRNAIVWRIEFDRMRPR